MNQRSANKAHSMEMPQQAREVLDFWFGEDLAQPFAHSERWFKKDPEFDALIGERFGESVLALERGELHAWREGPETALAYIVLADQFPRNMHRDSPRAFALDGLALQCSLAGQGQGFDASLPPVWRVFFYIPMEHSEEPALQQRSLQAFTRLREEADADRAEYFGKVVESAQRHHDIIERFGRFPHRNEVLGRESTPEETEFLTQPGSRF